MMILARRVLFWATLVGLFASVYLLIVYTSNAPIVCGVNHGCDVVRSSEWAYVFGVIPRPLMGVLFYAGFLTLLIVRSVFFAQWPVWLFRLTRLAAVIGFAESVWLVWVQYAYVQAFCDWCLVSAVATAVIFAASWGDAPAVLTPERSLRETRWQFISLSIAVVAGVVGLWWLL